MKTIGVLNLQGAVSEHITMLAKLEGIQPKLVKHPEDLSSIDGLIIPGGESTALSRLIKENNLYQPIQQFANTDKGILGTCAGLVLCGKSTTNIILKDQEVTPLGLMDIIVERNGFGRQIDSFETELNIERIGEHIPAIFIRAPYIAELGKDVIPLSYVDNHCVIAQSNNILVCSFHPELTLDLRIMQYFTKQFC